MDEKKVESIIFGLKETIAEKDKEIERLHGESADLNVKNATLEHENSELKQRVSILEADNDDYKNKIAEGELVSIDWHYSQVEDLEEEKMRLGHRLSETQYSLSVCQDVNAEQKAEIERLKEVNAGLALANLCDLPPNEDCLTDNEFEAARKTIVEQKAEIERLTEEHERIAWSKQQYLDWVHGFLSAHTDMKDRGEKFEMFDRDWMCGVFWEKIVGSLEYIIELENQRNELQKQVDELTEQNAQLSEMADYDKGHKEGYEHGAKTTAKDILQEMTNLVRNNEDFRRGVFGWQTSDILTLIKIYAKEKRGVEVD